MTAPFAASLCGYRTNGNPSTSDNNDRGSIEWGYAMFEALGVQAKTPEVANVGRAMEAAVADHLRAIRPDLVTRLSRSALEFDQYRHLGVFRQFTRSYREPTNELNLVLDDLEQIEQSEGIMAIARRLEAARATAQGNHRLVAELIESMPEESILKIDLTVCSPTLSDRLLVGLSSKWSLRTDRAQDCVSQGAKLVNLRRGHMPHYAVLTMEPRPAMLKLIAYGSGSVDCVYHLALPELRAAASALEASRGEPWPPRTLLERMVAQRRVRPYQDLIAEVERLP